MRPFDPNFTARQTALFIAANLGQNYDSQQTATQIVQEAAIFENFLNNGKPADQATPGEEHKRDREPAKGASDIPTPSEVFGDVLLNRLLKNESLVSRLMLAGIDTTTRLILAVPTALGLAANREEQYEIVSLVSDLLDRAGDKMPEEIRTSPVFQRILKLVSGLKILKSAEAEFDTNCPGCEHCAGQEIPAEVLAAGAETLRELEATFGKGNVEMQVLRVGPGESIQDAIKRAMTDRAAR